MKLIQLSDRGTAAITGADAASLLQGLVTCDIPAVQAAGIGYGALLTPQGKVLFDFMLHRSENGFIADLPRVAVEAFLKRLRLYKLRAAVDLADTTGTTAVVQMLDADSSSAPADPRHPGLGRRCLAASGEDGDDGAIEEYHQRRIGLAVPEAPWDIEYGEVFPHDVSLDDLGAISSTKGCYVGQEVVSRVRHRGTARRRVVVVSAATDLPATGAEIMAGDRAIGALGSRLSARGIASVRLDRAAAARAARTPVTCGGIEVDLELPAWASYGWPDPAAPATGSDG